MSVKNRLKEYIKYKNMAISDFEKSINASNGYINSINKSIGLDKLSLLVEKYSNLNLEWLLIGKGEMIKSEESFSHLGANVQFNKEEVNWEREYYKVLRDLNDCLKKNNELLEDKSHRAG